MPEHETETPADADELVYLAPMPFPWGIELKAFGLYYEALHDNPDDPDEQTGVLVTVLPTVNGPDGSSMPLVQAPAVRLYFGIEYFTGALLEDIRNVGRRKRPSRSGIVVAGMDDLPGAFNGGTG